MLRKGRADLRPTPYSPPPCLHGGLRSGDIMAFPPVLSGIGISRKYQLHLSDSNSLPKMPDNYLVLGAGFQLNLICVVININQFHNDVANFSCDSYIIICMLCYQVLILTNNGP